MEMILWAAEFIREARPRIPARTPAKLLALVLLMRYSGLRISDACMFRAAQLDDGKEFLFYDRVGKPESCIAE